MITRSGELGRGEVSEIWKQEGEVPSSPGVNQGKIQNEVEKTGNQQQRRVFRPKYNYGHLEPKDILREELTNSEELK